MKNLFLIIAVSLVTALVLMFWDAPPELFFLDDKTEVEAIPAADSYMQETETRKFDGDGSLAYVLRAENGFYYAADDRFELEKPRLVASRQRAQSAPWQLTADRARSSARGDSVNLSGSVHAWQPLADGRNEIFTDDIQFLPGDNIARTDSRVKLVHPEGTTTGRGMTADFDTGIYRLLADVRGYYRVR